MKKILIIDDDEVSIFVTKKLLEFNNDYDIITFKSAQKALYFLENNKIDLIFLDINMPCMDGFQFLEEFQKLNIESKPQVVICTSSDRKSDKDKSMKFENVIGYLDKSLQYQSIARILENLK